METRACRRGPAVNPGAPAQKQRADAPGVVLLYVYRISFCCDFSSSSLSLSRRASPSRKKSISHTSLSTTWTAPGLSRPERRGPRDASSAACRSESSLFLHACAGCVGVLVVVVVVVVAGSGRFCLASPANALRRTRRPHAASPLLSLNTRRTDTAAAPLTLHSSTRRSGLNSCLLLECRHLLYAEAS